jgi:hypothetical protein
MPHGELSVYKWTSKLVYPPIQYYVYSNRGEVIKSPMRAKS